MLKVVISGLKGDQVPFFVRPLTRAIANQLIAALCFPNMKKHADLLESYLNTSPDGGEYLCGKDLTGADIMLAYPLIAALNGAMDGMGQWEKGSFEKTYPRLWTYMNKLSKEPSWLKSAEKIREIEGHFSVLPKKL
jgi:glutathione S-transferase